MLIHAAMAVLLMASPLAAQTGEALLPPPHLSVLEGAADLERGPDREPAVPNTPLEIGDRLRTHAGRAEVLLGDGSAVHLDERTAIDINGDALVRLLEGRIIVLAEQGAAGTLQIDAAPASVRVLSSGEVRLALVDDGGALALEVGVVRGLVDVEGAGGQVSVRAGQHVLVREHELPTYPAPFNSARVDAFVAWSQGLTDMRRGTTSAEYLPPDVQAYGPTFDRHGHWSYEAQYGYVWYPRVAAGWRPYHHGRWRHSPRFGWSFIGYDPWGWATYHYGRWGISRAGAWFWIPKRGWGAAWVHWAVAPGYVGWCPLGFDNRPVLAFWGHRGLRVRHNPWRAWSVVPLDAFRHGRRIHRVRFDPHALVRRGGPQFVLQDAAPRVAVPRRAGVTPEYRITGPSATADRAVRRPGATALDTAGRVGRLPQRDASTTGAVRTMPEPSRSSRGYAVPRGRESAPGVTYYRGTRRSDGNGERDTRAADPYERAGVAVPRTGPARTGQPLPGSVTRSPYGTSASPYAVRRPGRAASGGSVGRTPPTASSGADPAVEPERSAPRGYAPRYAPRHAPASPPPSRRTSPGSAGPRAGAAPRASAPARAPRSGGSASAPSPRAVPRAGAAPSPRSSSGAAAPPRSRSGGDGGSRGTARPRGGGSRR
jgi:hypothetical protein